MASHLEADPFFDKLQDAILSRNEAAFLALVSPDADIQQQQIRFIRSVLAFPYRTGVIRLAEEKADRLVLHVFLQGAEEARFESWVITARNSPENQKQIRSSNTINAVTGLYRLKMSDRPFRVRNLKFKHVDSAIQFKRGHIFPIHVGTQIAGLFFIGDASFEFEPKDAIERQQVTLFVKKPKLETVVTRLFIRSSPEGLREFLQPLEQQNPKPDAALYSRAMADAKDFDRNVYSVRIPFSEELWFAQMEAGELYYEMKTALGTLLYQHSPTEPEDILLVRKEKEQIISLYDSSAERAPKDTTGDFEILSYKMKLRFQPAATHLTAVTQVKLQSGKETSSIIFRLNPELRVSHIRSSQGYLIYFQERKTNNLHLVLNETLRKGDQIELEFFYQGKIEPEKRAHEAMALQRSIDSNFYLPPTFLYSNTSVWYPQLNSRPYSEVEASITVPDNYAAVINGLRTNTDSEKGNTTFFYKCALPAKYFSLFVGRLDSHLRIESVVPIDVYFVSMDRAAAEDHAAMADRMLRFYSTYFGKYPYQNFAIILRPIQQPGGHAPATVAIVNRVFKFFQQKFGKDPLHIPEYPQFLLAHEIAHQWWGQAIGWKTYRDQWLSEGFAQFAAWEYMRHHHGDKAWKKLADVFQQWVEEKSYAGPLILGARLGHITDDPQAFSALLYNKGAFTLNMLKHWMGPENFGRCLAEFFEAYRFSRTGVNEFKAIAQKHSKEDLRPFFDQWLYDWHIPEIGWKTRVDNSQLTVMFEQHQSKVYQLRIPVVAKSESGQTFRFIASVEKENEEVKIDLPFVATSVEVDPLHETLMKVRNR